MLDNIAQSPKLHERLAQAELVSKVEATGNFSYISKRCHGANYLMLGDAYAFIDPVFSSGVWLAMHSGRGGRTNHRHLPAQTPQTGPGGAQAV